MFLAHCGSVSEAKTKGISREYRKTGKEGDYWKLKIDAHGIKCKKERKREIEVTEVLWWWSVIERSTKR